MPMHMVCVLDTRHHTCSHYFGLSDTIVPRLGLWGLADEVDIL